MSLKRGKKIIREFIRSSKETVDESRQAKNQ